VNSVWLRARAELRSGWRRSLALALMMGLAGGAVIGAAVGARRTHSAYERFLVAQRSMDVVASPAIGYSGIPDLVRVEKFPEVADSARVYLLQGVIHTPSGREATFPGVFPLLDPSGRFGATFNVMKFLSGRAPVNPYEVAVSFGVAQRYHIELGDRLRFDLYGHDANGDANTQVVKRLTFDVVGIEAAPGEFETLGAQNIAAIHLAPALAKAEPATLYPTDQSLVLKLRPGPGRLRRFFAHAEREGVPLDSNVTLADQDVGVQRGNEFQAVALWLIAAITAITGVAVFGQTLARQTFIESIEYPTLRALGMTRGQLWAVSLLRAGAMAAVATGLAVVVAILLSPLTPTGAARIAEPRPGLWIDAIFLAIGAAAILIVFVLLAMIPGYRAARARGNALGTAEVEGRERPLRFGSAASDLGLPRSAVIGIAMATQPGRGRTAVPIRTAILGTTFGVVTVVAALTFSASINQLTRSPALFGWNWDVIAFGASDRPSQQAIDRDRSMLSADPDVAAFAEGTADTIVIGGTELLAIGLDPNPSVHPAMIEGQPPLGSNEIALGTDTMRSLHLSIGDTIRVRGGNDESQGVPGRHAQMRVVGRIAMPSFFFSFNRPGRGAAVTLAGMKLLRPGAQGDGFYLKFKPGVDPRAAQRRLRALHFFVLPGQEPGDLASVRRIARVPLLLAGLLAALSAATLGHTLITSTRQRRRDFALLRTLGFVRRQVQLTVAWQASTLIVVAMAIGIPVGVAAGRWAWRLFTDSLGVVPQPVISWVVLSLLVPGTLLLANLIAFLPGRIAGRVRPAVVLRTE
jgi:ABC-type lipoprotein release transport system permease subunit